MAAAKKSAKPRLRLRFRFGAMKNVGLEKFVLAAKFGYG